MVKVLNLYAGLGGNRKYWKNCEVVAVEKDEKIAKIYSEQNPQDTTIIGDAHDYLLKHFEEFDFIWSSPPCQSHSRMIRSGRNRKPTYPDMRLYEEILFLKYNFKGLWIVENVIPYYPAPFDPLKIGRHLFWSNFDIPRINPPEFKGFISRQNMKAKEALMEWLDIKYEGNVYYGKNHCVTQVLRNCVHPIVGDGIFKEAKRKIEELKEGEL